MDAGEESDGHILDGQGFEDGTGGIEAIQGIFLSEAGERSSSKLLDPSLEPALAGQGACEKGLDRSFDRPPGRLLFGRPIPQGPAESTQPIAQASVGARQERTVDLVERDGDRLAFESPSQKPADLPSFFRAGVAKGSACAGEGAGLTFQTGLDLGEETGEMRPFERGARAGSFPQGTAWLAQASMKNRDEA